MSNHDPVVIVAAARTPMGNLLGELASVPGPELGAAAIKAAVERAKLKPEDVDEVIMGCVLSAGMGQAPARQAALKADLPKSVHCSTVNKMCGSGMQSVIFAYDALSSCEPKEIIVAGGLESMTNAPYLLQKARQGYRLGHDVIKDHMFLDGLEDAYEHQLMGTYAENTATKYKFSREAQDKFAINSLQKAQKAIDNGQFKDEIVPITVTTRKGSVEVCIDEGPGSAKIDKIPHLKPAFKKDGTVTAANSSSISDGAAALVLMRESTAKKHGCKPLAKIIAHASYSQDPAWFTTAPVGAVKSVLEKAQWKISDVDLFEINEAFAVVTMAAIEDLSLPAEKVNIHGGACALGHPIGASGARILVTLLYALKHEGLKRGVAALCIGGGEATAVAVELV